MTVIIHPLASAAFVVVIDGVEPPPGWTEHVFTKLSREMELMYGNSASVRPLINYAMPVVEAYTTTNFREVLIVPGVSGNGVRPAVASGTPGRTPKSDEVT